MSSCLKKISIYIFFLLLIACTKEEKTYSTKDFKLFLNYKIERASGEIKFEHFSISNNDLIYEHISSDGHLKKNVKVPDKELADLAAQLKSWNIKETETINLLNYNEEDYYTAELYSEINKENYRLNIIGGKDVMKADEKFKSFEKFRQRLLELVE